MICGHLLSSPMVVGGAIAVGGAIVVVGAIVVDGAVWIGVQVGRVRTGAISIGVNVVVGAV